MNIDALNQILEKLDEISEKATLKNIFLPKRANVSASEDEGYPFNITDLPTRNKITNGLPIRLPYIETYNTNEGSIYICNTIQSSTKYIYHTHGARHTSIEVDIVTFNFKFL